LAQKLLRLLGKQSNENGAISTAIGEYRRSRERIEAIESELQKLQGQRKHIDNRISELESEHTEIFGCSHRNVDRSNLRVIRAQEYIREASPHILGLLQEKQAYSEQRGVDRGWLNEQLINKVKGVKNHTAISWGIIELAKKGEVDHEGGRKSRRPIGKVWLLGNRDKSFS
jgi:hypothetical protein